MYFSRRIPILSLVICMSTITTLARPNQKRPEYPTRLVYEAPDGTWLENLAVRSNGQVLFTRLDQPELYLIDPSLPDSKPALVHRFNDYLSAVNLVETTPDHFAFIAGNYSFTTGNVPGSYALWKIDMTNVSVSCDGKLEGAPLLHKVTDVPEASMINGMSRLTNDLVLVGDLFVGNVRRVNVQTGAYSIISQDALMAPAYNPLFGRIGIDGLHVSPSGKELFFANVGQNLFAKLPIDPTTGEQLGNATIVARTLNSSMYFDDFTLDEDGRAFLVTGSGNSIEELQIATGKGRIVAGNLNSTALAQPTAAQFGRGKHEKDVLYVTTGGGLIAPVDGTIVIGAQLVAVDMSKRR